MLPAMCYCLLWPVELSGQLHQQTEGSDDLVSNQISKITPQMKADTVLVNRACRLMSKAYLQAP